jgi:FMN reductase [NAD(P)H]
MPSRDGQNRSVDFADVLARRRMVRNYQDRPVDPEALERIADAALRAPSAGNSRAIAVVIVTDPATRAAIARLADEDDYVVKGFDPWISRAPAHLVISVSEKVYRDRYSEPDKAGPDGSQIDWPVPYWWVDAGAALMTVLLATIDEGLAAGFLGAHSLHELSELLSLPDHHQPIGVVTVGHPAPDRKSTSLDRPPQPRHAVVHHERWQEG